jgi:hypothetical protein
MPASLVIEHFEVVEQLHLRLAVTVESFPELALDRREEAFHHGVVVAIAAPAHTAHDAAAGQEALVVLARVRAALIGMMQQADLGGLDPVS